MKDLKPHLAQLIDEFDPTDDYVVYKLKCPWGQHLLQEGTLCLPNSEGHWVKIDDPSLDPKIVNDLIYNITMPLGLVLKNSVELYIDVLGRVIPFVFMQEGALFGLWVSFHQDKSVSNHTGRVSNIIAGSKSALFLPKISDATSFKKLKKVFGLQCRVPDTLIDQWPLLLELSQHSEFPEKWETEVLYFSKKWLEPNEDISWKLLRNYLLELAWEGSSYLRNQMIFDLAFSCALQEKNLKPNPYLTDTVKHLFSIGQGIYPGYMVANDNMALPLTAFQEIFIDIYGLKYQPTMMVPGYLKPDPMKPVYYSLEVPTLMAFSPKSRKVTNKLEDLREIKHVMQRTIDYLREDDLRLKQTPLYTLINEVEFGYYHTDEDIYNETLKTPALQGLDESIIQQSAQYKNKDFCDTSPFLRGCIRLATKNISGN